MSETLTLGELLVDDLVRPVVGHDRDRVEALLLVDADPARLLGDRRLALGHARLEQLLHTRQTTGDVVADATLVERTHRELGTGLTDRLGGDDADGLADVHQLTGRHRAAVAGGADAGAGGAGQDRAHLDLLHAGADERLDGRVAQVCARRHDDRAVGVDRVLGERPGERRGLDVLVALEDTRGVALGVHDRTGDGRLHALAGATVGLADDDVLGDVDQTTGEVARVGGTQGGVGQTLTRTVRVHEVLEHRQALAERGLDGLRDELAVRTGHQALHAGQRPDLGHVARRARLHDRRDRVVVRVVGLHGLADLVGGLLPELDQVALALLVGDLAEVVLRLQARGLGVVRGEDFLLGRRHEHVGHGDGDTRPGGPVEAGVLELVHRLRHDDHRVALGQVVDDDGLTLLRHLLVDERVVRREQLVEHDAAERGLGQPLLPGGPALGELLRLDLGAGALLRHPDPDRGVDVEHTQVDGHDGLGRGRVHAGRRRVVGGGPVGALGALVQTGQVVEARDHVQTRHGERTTRRRRQDVVRREHEDARLGLRLRGQREVHGHLVAVEVGVEGLTHERVQLDGLALDELRLERLDTQAVQGRSAVEHHRVLGDDLFEHVPHLIALTLDHALGGLDVLRVVEVDEPLHDERLEQLERHQLGQTALV